MQTSKSLIVGISAFVVVAILCIVLICKDEDILLSGKEAQNLFSQSQVSDVMADSTYVYFRVEDTKYKVYINALPERVWSWNLPVLAKSEYGWNDILGDFGIGIILLLGFAVLVQGLRLSFKHKPNTHSTQNTHNKPLEKHNELNIESHILNDNPMSSGITFKDVAGISEVKEELLEVIDYLKNPKHYQELGIYLPKGVLLIGPPGVGKTMIAKAVAGEAGVPFFYQSGSSFVQIYVGMGAKRVRELFLKAKAKAPSIIFIDEIDAVGKARGNARSDERDATLNQLLTEMDGFEDSNGVIVIGATNKIEMLDEALLRSGRFDRRIYVDLPNLSEREAILSVYLQGKQHELDINDIARICVGFSGAAIASLVNEAALNALRRNSKIIQKDDILATKDKVLIGKKKRLSFSEEERQVLAIYQAAKALSAYWLEVDFDKIGLVSEGFKQIDKELVSKQELLNKIKVALSGNVAIEMIYGQTFSNAKDDVNLAKDIATQMCEQYGMAGRLLSDNEDILDILESAKKDMQDFLNDSKHILLKLSKVLLEEERLSKEVIKDLLEDAFER